MELSKDEELNGWYDKEKEREMLFNDSLEYEKEQARKIALEESKIDIAKKLKDKNMNIQEISDITGLDIVDIKKL